MSINEHAIKQQVNRHINSAMLAIKNKATNLQWTKTVINIADELSKLSRSIQAAKGSVQHFGNMQLQQAGRLHAYRVKQSINSKTNTLSDLEKYIDNEWNKVRQVLKYEEKKSPFDGKNEVELLDMLAGEIESFDKLLKQNASMVTQTLSNTEMKTQATIVQREINHLKTLPNATAPSMLLLISIGLRLASGLFVSKK